MNTAEQQLAAPDIDLLRRAARVKLAVCDLDGTLLGPDKVISQHNLDVIARAADRGLETTICSGRIYPMMEAFHHALGQDVPVITVNGGVIVRADGTVARGVKQDVADVYQVLSYAIKNHSDLGILADEGCWFTSGSARRKYFEKYNETAAEAGLDLLNIYELPFPQVPVRDEEIPGLFPVFETLELRKMLLYELDPARYDDARNFLVSNNIGDLTTSDPGLIEILPHGVNKGSGLQLLMDHMGLSAEEVMVFGDFDNDLPLFDVAGFGVAMGNAIPELRQRADYVTLSNADDGVAAALEILILNNPFR